MIDITNFKVNPRRCKTCPFNDDGCIDIRNTVIRRILTEEKSQVCHGTNNKTLCRGARDYQQQIYFRLGVLEAPTDEAWDKKRQELNC
ncbi:hypothetical protein [Myxosarcina sp. GI1]|uniref:hypothetical protein n=1 Tax=Myxosarcina sp. GI1 TaxID=1541065 RepID=UPI00056AD082|nr:hypothetical protein [Myxosarcina sp. GI1]